MYEDLRQDVKWEQDKPRGAIFHVASTDSSGNVHVADVWKSQEQLNDFVSKRLMPAMQKRNIIPPKVDIFQVHNINAFSGVDGFKYIARTCVLARIYLSKTFNTAVAELIDPLFGLEVA